MNIVEICTVAIAFCSICGMGYTLLRLGSVAGTMQATLVAVKDELHDQKDDIKEQKLDIKEIGKALAEVSAQKQRMDSFSHMLVTLQEEVRDLRRGEGFVLPLEEALRKKIIGP